MARALPLVFLLVALATLSGCGAIAPRVIGSGNAQTEQRTVDAFTKVRVDESVQATVTVGPAISVAVTTDDNVLGSVQTTVANGRLSIGINGSIQPRVPVTVVITVPALDEVGAGSAARATVTGIDSPSFTAAADSAGSVVAQGTSGTVNVSATSAGTADLSGVAAQSATATATSGGRAVVNATQSVAGTANSAGVVHVMGNPPTVNVTTNTGGAVVRD